MQYVRDAISTLWWEMSDCNLCDLATNYLVVLNLNDKSCSATLYYSGVIFCNIIEITKISDLFGGKKIRPTILFKPRLMTLNTSSTKMPYNHRVPQLIEIIFANLVNIVNQGLDRWWLTLCCTILHCHRWTEFYMMAPNDRENKISCQILLRENHTINI